MKTPEELSVMTLSELSNHIIDITQTEICKDAKYCKMVMDFFTKR